MPITADRRQTSYLLPTARTLQTFFIQKNLRKSSHSTLSIHRHHHASINLPSQTAIEAVEAIAPNIGRYYPCHQRKRQNKQHKTGLSAPRLALIHPRLSTLLQTTSLSADPPQAKCICVHATLASRCTHCFLLVRVRLSKTSIIFISRESMLLAFSRL